MTNEPLKPLPVRVEPHRSESLLSLIIRAADANVYPRTAQLVALAGITTLRSEFIPFTKRLHAEAIAQRLGLPAKEITLRMHSPEPGVPMSDWVDWFGTPIPRDFINASAFRYTATSLKKAAFHRAMWMLKPLKFCCDSMEYLVATCPHCHCKLGWKYGRQADVCEKCKSPLTNAGTTSVAPQLQSIAKAAACLVDPDKNVRTTALNQLPDAFADWPPGEVFAAIVELGAATTHPLSNSESTLVAQVGHGDFSTYTTEHLVRGYEFLHQWPSSLRELLGAVINTDMSSGPLRKYLYGARSPSRLRELIRASFPAQVRELESPLYASRGRRAHWIRSDGLITQINAVAEFHIHKAALRRLDNGGRCVPQKGCRHGSKAYIRQALENSVAILRSSVGVDQCARAIGVPMYCVAALADRGLLKAVEDHDACLIADRPIYERCSLDKLVESVSKVPVAGNNRGVSINNIMHGRFHPEDWADLVNGVALGTLRATRIAGVSIASYFVDEDEGALFRRQLPKRQLPHDVFVSIITAARLLCINEPAAGKAIAIGLLPARRKSKHIKIALHEIGKFYTKYFVSTEARLRYGLNGRSFGRRMREMGFASVGTIHKLPVWAREEVDQVFGARHRWVHAEQVKSLMLDDALSHVG